MSPVVAVVVVLVAVAVVDVVGVAVLPPIPHMLFPPPFPKYWQDSVKLSLLTSFPGMNRFRS